MLVLTRKLNERLLIDDGIEIKVLGVNGNRVKLGINAPNHVGIRRAEIEVRVGGEQVEHADCTAASSQVLAEA